MVAIINHSKSVRNVLSYNERKVTEGKADLILASKFLCEIDSLAFSAKLNRFRYLNQVNPRVRTNTLHISLNFDPSERLSMERLQEIAVMYMEKIGFGDQPFLVYQHHDASHPHVHVVSSLIQADGHRINTHNIGRNLSEPARKEIEKKFGLIPADSKNKVSLMDTPVAITKAIYGATETKKAIGSAVAYVVKEYRFTSIPELNAALRPYNVIADIGEDGSYLRKHHGIQYRVLTAQGDKVGVPIKGSSLPGKPTLFALNKKFQINEILRKAHKQRLTTFLSAVLASRAHMNATQFKTILARNEIDVLYRVNTTGRMYGITFVDHRSGCVFNGSDLSKNLAAASLGKFFESGDKQLAPGHQQTTGTQISRDGETDMGATWPAKLVDALGADSCADHELPYDLSPRKRRKKKKKRNQ